MQISKQYCFRDLDLDMITSPVFLADVFLTSTSVNHLLELGAKRVLVGSQDATIKAKRTNSEYVLISDNISSKNYDLLNQPVRFTKDEIQGKICLINTSNGSLALAKLVSFLPIYLFSFLNFSATVSFIERNKYKKVTLVSVGNRNGAEYKEDDKCIELLEKKIIGASYDFEDTKREIQKILLERYNKHFTRGELLEKDIDFCLNIDKYDSIVQVMKSDNGLLEAKLI